MNLADAQRYALEKMAEHGLLAKGWTFKFDNRRTSYGTCNYTQLTISLSRSLTLASNEDGVKDTVLHEIAHALTRGEHHGPLWKLKAMELGARPETCSSSKADVDKIDAPYWSVCPGCGYKAPRFRCPTWRNLGTYHTRCGPVKGKVEWRTREGNLVFAFNPKVVSASELCGVRLAANAAHCEVTTPDTETE